MTQGAIDFFEEDMRQMGAMQMSKINPPHYDIVIKGHKYQAVDLIEALFPQDAHMSQALKYLMRAGRKAEESYLADVNKCLWWCAKAIMFHGGKVELPRGALSRATK